MKQMPAGNLEPGMILAQDVFVQDTSIPLITKNTILTPGMIAAMLENHVSKISVVGQSDAEIVTSRPRPILDQSLRFDALSNLEDIFLLTAQGDDIHLNVTETVRQMDAVVDRLVRSLLEERNALVNIADLKSYDEYTYHHSLSVSVLAIAIGDALKLPVEELNQLGRAAMMHDIGKTAIPLEIINKPARLTAEEFERMKSHSPEGYQYLSLHGIGNDTLLQSVLFHHERVDGAGYPFGLDGSKIPLMSRIISVADVYDALTSHRPYRKPMEPSEAIEYVMGNVDAAFDYDIVTAFVKKLELYPAGSLVELSDERLALVIATENPLRPVVKLVEGGGVLDLFNDPKLLSLTVRRVLPQIG